MPTFGSWLALLSGLGLVPSISGLSLVRRRCLGLSLGREVWFLKGWQSAFDGFRVFDWYCVKIFLASPQFVVTFIFLVWGTSQVNSGWSQGDTTLEWYCFCFSWTIPCVIIIDKTPLPDTWNASHQIYCFCLLAWLLKHLWSVYTGNGSLRLLPLFHWHSYRCGLYRLYVLQRRAALILPLL